MSEERKGTRQARKGGRGQTIFLGVVFGIPLFFRLGWVYLGFRRKAKKAGSLFKKQLLTDGVDKDAAEVLTNQYLRSSEFLSEIIRAQGHRA